MTTPSITHQQVSAEPQSAVGPSRRSMPITKGSARTSPDSCGTKPNAAKPDVVKPDADEPNTGEGGKSGGR